MKASAPTRFGNYVLLAQHDLRLSSSTAAPFAPSGLVLARAARLVPFAAGPFALYRHGAFSRGTAAWRTAIRDRLRAPSSPLRVPLLEANADDSRVPFFFITPWAFGISLAVVVGALASGGGITPAPLARALSAGLRAHVADALALVAAAQRPRLARIDALHVTLEGTVVDFGFAPFALTQGPAAGEVDIDRAARAYGALLAQVPACEAEASAFALLQSAANANVDAGETAEADRAALGAFVAGHFRQAVRDDAQQREEHSVLDEALLNRMLASASVQ